MKNILLIMPYGSVGGMERLALSFYTHYKSLGYQVKGLKFIKLSNDLIDFGEDELFLKHYDFSAMSKKERLLFYIKMPYLIFKIVKKYNITHSIAFGDMANLFSSLSFSNEYKIGSIHALKSVELSNNSVFNKITRLGYKSFYRNLDKLVCISKAIKEDLTNNFNYQFKNIVVIYNPHDIKKIIHLSKELIQDENERKIFSKKTILFLGRLSAQKAPWHLIKAFKLVLEKDPDVNLVIIGDGDMIVTNYIKSIIHKLTIEKNIYFLGRRSNPFKYLAAADVLVLSSHYEGTPNVIVEAICLETPIVSSNCTDGILELMSLNKHNKTNQNIVVESGIVTPNLFKGELGIPMNDNFIEEENLFANAVYDILTNKDFSNNIKKNSKNLLSKFDLKTVAYKYLEPN